MLSLTLISKVCCLAPHGPEAIQVSMVFLKIYIAHLNAYNQSMHMSAACPRSQPSRGYARKNKGMG